MPIELFCASRRKSTLHNSGLGQSHRGLCRLLLIVCAKNFIFASFFLVCFSGLFPSTSLGEPAQCSAVLCIDIHASWKASPGPWRDRAVRSVVPKLEAGLIICNTATPEWLLYSGTRDTPMAVSGTENSCSLLCHIVQWRCQYCRWVLKCRREASGCCVSLKEVIHCC